MAPGMTVASESLPPEALSVAALVQHCLPLVHKWAHGRVPRAARREFDTHDLVQEAALRMLRRGPRFEPRHACAVQAYLRQTVLNLARDKARELVRRPRPVEIVEELPCRDASPLEVTIANERRTLYLKALRRLTPKDRRLLVARIQNELKLKEIADAVGLPSEGAATVALSRAVKRLVFELSRVR